MDAIAPAAMLIAAALLAPQADARPPAPSLPYQPMATQTPVQHGAPGRWRDLRRYAPGWIVPSYWTARGFSIDDYRAYGLAPPPPGYGWQHYYDGAVLVDREGRVYDSVDTITPDEGRRGPPPGAYSYDYDGVTVDGRHYRGTWTGSWTGSYDGAPVQRYYGRFDGGYRDADGWRGAAHPPPGAGGYVAGGWYYPAPTVTTIVIQSQPVPVDGR